MGQIGSEIDLLKLDSDPRLHLERLCFKGLDKGDACEGISSLARTGRKARSQVKRETISLCFFGCIFLFGAYSQYAIVALGEFLILERFLHHALASHRHYRQKLSGQGGFGGESRKQEAAELKRTFDRRGRELRLAIGRGHTWGQLGNGRLHPDYPAKVHKNDHQAENDSGRECPGSPYVDRIGDSKRFFRQNIRSRDLHQDGSLEQPAEQRRSDAIDCQADAGREPRPTAQNEIYRRQPDSDR